MRPVAIIEAPSILGLRPTGVETLPDALLRAGLLERLQARSAGRLDAPEYNARRDPETGFLNPTAIAGYSRLLAARIQNALADSFVLVLGGDCSILLGSMLALRRRGRHGLLFLDGHMDFYNPEANINGEVASSDLALATGRGPAPLTTWDGLCPLVRDEDVVAFGFRDELEAESYGSQPLPPGMKAMNLDTIRTTGIDAAAPEAVAHASANGSRPFWIHLDADVLDDSIMPAVDYRLAGGLSWEELETVLSCALASPSVAGMEVTIFNPTLDPDGSIRNMFVGTLARSFRRAQSTLC